MSEKLTGGTTSTKRTKLSQSEFPINSLDASLRIAQALWDHFAGKGAAPHDIALALEMSPTSGSWRNLCGSSIAYGLTDGGYAAEEIVLSDLGKRIVAPTAEGDDNAAKIDAIQKPRIMGEFFHKYDKAKFPREDIGKNVLVGMGLPKDRADKAFGILEENGRNVGVIMDTKTGPFVALKSSMGQTGQISKHAPEEDEVVEDETFDAESFSDEDIKAPEKPAEKPTKDTPKQLFVAHGKNHKPLEDLKKILDEFKIPYKVAIDEPNKGRPISGKVAELMNECSAGIFIFTKDEQFFQQDKNGEHNEIWRPSENVVYELGAANILWDRKIIILREDGVNFPSDFSDLGYITFSDGEIAHKALDVLKELVALGLVKFSAT